jgi:hypothetical protein
VEGAVGHCDYDFCGGEGECEGFGGQRDGGVCVMGGCSCRGEVVDMKGCVPGGGDEELGCGIVCDAFYGLAVA